MKYLFAEYEAAFLSRWPDVEIGQEADSVFYHYGVRHECKIVRLSKEEFEAKLERFSQLEADLEGVWARYNTAKKAGMLDALQDILRIVERLDVKMFPLELQLLL